MTDTVEQVPVSGYSVIPSSSAQSPPVPPIPMGHLYEVDSGAAPSRVSPVIPVLLLLVCGVVAGGLWAVFAAKSPQQAPSFQDLGAGISKASGLKGNLQVRWQSTAQYQLKIEPIDPLQHARFSLVAAHPPSPLWFKIRLLDVTGFALCNKEILFRFDPSKAAAGAQSRSAVKIAYPGNGANSAESAALKAEANRESGRDVFEEYTGDDGKVAAMSAQGDMPCTQAQFQQASYWDFTTNFPSVQQQDALLKRSANAGSRETDEERDARNRNARKLAPGFIAEGDDRATSYDASSGVLEARLGLDFLVTRVSDRNTATAWASAESLFHYRCDQRARCLLTHAGEGDTIPVLALQ